MVTRAPATMFEDNFCVIGYIDPNYMQTNQYRPSSDVYSMGIVQMQVLTGEPEHFLSSPIQGVSLMTVIAFCDMYTSDLHRLLKDSHTTWPDDIATEVLNMAFNCTETGRHACNRPNAEACVAILESLVSSVEAR